MKAAPVFSAWNKCRLFIAGIAFSCAIDAATTHQPGWAIALAWACLWFLWRANVPEISRDRSR